MNRPTAAPARPYAGRYPILSHPTCAQWAPDAQPTHADVIVAARGPIIPVYPIHQVRPPRQPDEPASLTKPGDAGSLEEWLA